MRTCNQFRVPESEEQLLYFENGRRRAQRRRVACGRSTFKMSPTLSYSRANSINTAIRKASGDGSNSRANLVSGPW